MKRYAFIDDDDDDVSPSPPLLPYIFPIVLFLSFYRRIVLLQQNLVFGYTHSLCRRREQQAHWTPADGFTGVAVWRC
jgi:hypothetical protein